jgi:hypothetical protein
LRRDGRQRDTFGEELAVLQIERAHGLRSAGGAVVDSGVVVAGVACVAPGVVVTTVGEVVAGAVPDVTAFSNDVVGAGAARVGRTSGPLIPQPVIAAPRDAATTAQRRQLFSRIVK